MLFLLSRPLGTKAPLALMPLVYSFLLRFVSLRSFFGPPHFVIYLRLNPLRNIFLSWDVRLPGRPFPSRFPPFICGFLQIQFVGTFGFKSFIGVTKQDNPLHTQ